MSTYLTLPPQRKLSRTGNVEVVSLESGGNTNKSRANLHVVSLALFLKWFATDPCVLSQYALLAFGELDEAKYGNVSFSTVLMQVRERSAELNIKLALLSATVPFGLSETGNIAVFQYSLRRFPLTTLHVEIEHCMNSCDVITEIGKNLLGLGHTSILFFSGESAITTACESGGKEFFSFHAKLTDAQIEAARRGASSPRCVCSSN